MREEQASIVAGAAVFLAACDSGSGDTEASQGAQSDAIPPAADAFNDRRVEAFRFLNQATFGATERDADELGAIGMEAWIDDQVARTPTLQLPYLQSLPRPTNLGALHRDRAGAWLLNALQAPDQLRQRVAFALSEIMVVSQIGALEQAPYALASYYDLLVEHAFGNFRDLMQSVTLHPAMGVYLSMLGNQKPNSSTNVRPDENFARELMQLFTIGLVELNADGTQKLDAAGEPIPTYDQSVIEGFAHVYTGWTYAGHADFLQARVTDDNQVRPMQLYPDYHDAGPKRLLRGVTLPAGQSGARDLTDALDNVFSHPNVGPFLASRLIQRLVTSNPSPSYVARVARAFDDNGSGVRGDLESVVRAILLDPEARPTPTNARSGKLKEPLIRLTQLWRAFNARADNDKLAALDLVGIFGQGPLQAPSVFNFFSPFYSPPGEIKDAALVAPEMEIATEFQTTLITNFLFSQCFLRNTQSPGLTAEDVVIDIEEEVQLAHDPNALIDRVSKKLLGGLLSEAVRSEILALIERYPPTERAARVAHVIFYVVTSPHFAVQQ